MERGVEEDGWKKIEEWMKMEKMDERAKMKFPKITENQTFLCT